MSRSENLRHESKFIRAVATLALSLSLAAPLVRAADPPPEKGWETVATVGFTLSSGNTKNYLLSALINSSRKWTRDELLLGGSGGYGKTTTHPATGPDVETKTDDYLKGYAQWNHLLTERLYAGLRFDAVHDDIADVDYRLTLSPLMGYYFIKETNTFLALEAGPAFVYEKQGGQEHKYVAARVAQRFEYKFSNGAKIWDTVDWVPQLNDFDNWVLTAEAGVSAPLSKSVDVRLIIQDTYDNQPAAGRLKNDFKLIAGIGVRF